METSNKFFIIIGKYITALIFILFATVSFSETIELSVPAYSDGTHVYFHDLLKQSLEANGHKVTLKSSFKIQKTLPQKRAVYMFENDSLSIMWLLQSKERDKKYASAEVGITDNLIGHRILLIPRGKQHLYNAVNNLDDFRKTGLAGGFDESWFDVEVWNANNLKIYELDGAKRLIYRMVAEKNRGVDYFSRGFNEIITDAAAHPDLDIEKRLMLIYDRDFLFYLSPSTVKYKKILEDSLGKAKSSGLMNKLIRRHWAKAFTQLNFDKRVKIYLKTPE